MILIEFNTLFIQRHDFNHTETRLFEYCITWGVLPVERFTTNYNSLYAHARTRSPCIAAYDPYMHRYLPRSPKISHRSPQTRSPCIVAYDPCTCIDLSVTDSSATLAAKEGFRADSRFACILGLLVARAAPLFVTKGGRSATFCDKKSRRHFWIYKVETVGRRGQLPPPPPPLESLSWWVAQPSWWRRAA